MEDLIKVIVKKYNNWDSNKRAGNPRQLALYLTTEGSFHLVDCDSSHCTANSKYSKMADKQLFITKFLSENWKIGKSSCGHGTFQDLTEADLFDNWEDNILIEKTGHWPCLKPV